MNIFISWSGPLSKAIGEEFRNWIPTVLQIVKPYFTPDDVEKGARWNGEIATELEVSEVGIIILTKENLQSAWIMFEAGALSKSLRRSRICPILFGIENTDLQGPLVQFQACSFNKEDVRKLIEMINNACGENKLSDAVLSGVFDMWWPSLEENITKIMDKFWKRGALDIRSERELLEEILSLARVVSIRRVEGEASKINIHAPLRHLQLLQNKLAGAVDAEDFDEVKDIIGELNRPMAFLSRYSSEPVEMLETPSSKEASGLRLIDDPKAQINKILTALSTREQRVLALRFGLEDGKILTLEEVGREFDVSRDRIRQIEAISLRKLRHPARSRKLKDILVSGHKLEQGYEKLIRAIFGE